MIDPLFVDVYPGDHQCDWATYIEAGPPWHGAIWKLSQGLHLDYAAWVHKQRMLFLSSNRWKRDLFDGFYHYLDLADDGARQAEWFCHIAKQLGGECLPGMVDVERGGQSIKSPSKQLVVNCTSEFCMRYEQLTGRQATLYGGELLRSVGIANVPAGISSRMGAGRSAIACYAPRLPHDLIVRTGTDLEHLMFWQYRGTDPQEHGPIGYPMTAPGCGQVDISACVLPGGLDAIRALI